MHLPSLTLLTTCLLLLGSDLVTLTESSGVGTGNKIQGSETSAEPKIPDNANEAFTITGEDCSKLHDLKLRGDVSVLRYIFGTWLKCPTAADNPCHAFRSIMFWGDPKSLAKEGKLTPEDVTSARKIYTAVIKNLINYGNYFRHSIQGGPIHTCWVSQGGVKVIIGYLLREVKQIFANGPPCSEYASAVARLLYMLADFGMRLSPSQDFIALEKEAKNLCAGGNSAETLQNMSEIMPYNRRPYHGV